MDFDDDDWVAQPKWYDWALYLVLPVTLAITLVASGAIILWEMLS